MAQESIPAFLQLTAGLTRVRCECCGYTGEDPTVHLLVAEAVLTGLREVERLRSEVREADQKAWAEAQGQLEAARGGR